MPRSNPESTSACGLTERWFCTITGHLRQPERDPATYECVDCNMVCAARLRLTSQDGLAPVIPPSVQGERRKQTPGAVETPEYCQQALPAVRGQVQIRPEEQEQVRC